MLQVTLVLQGESWEMVGTVNQTRDLNFSFYSSDASSRTGQHCRVEQNMPRLPVWEAYYTILEPTGSVRPRVVQDLP